MPSYLYRDSYYKDKTVSWPYLYNGDRHTWKGGLYIETPGWGWGGVGALPLWESVGMCCSFAPHFRHLDDLFAPQIWPCLPFHSDLVGSCFQSPPFSACRRSFCPPKLTKSINLFRSCWVPFWTLSAAPLLILNDVTPPPPRLRLETGPRYLDLRRGLDIWIRSTICIHVCVEWRILLSGSSNFIWNFQFADSYHKFENQEGHHRTAHGTQR